MKEKSARMGFKATITIGDRRKYKLHDCRLEGNSLSGKLPNGVEIELPVPGKLLHDQRMLIAPPN